MIDEKRSKKELVLELQELRRRVAELERTRGERLQIDEAFQEVEERYRQVSEASFDGILVTEEGVIVEADDTIAEITRRDPSELVGLQFEDLIQRENDLEKTVQILERRERVVEAELIREDGMSVSVELSTKRGSEADSVAVTAVRDLTPVKSVERKAAETEERFRAIFEAVPEVIYLKDSHLKLTHVNPAMETLFGVPASELLRLGEEDLYGKQAAEQIKKWDSRALEGQIVEEEHTRIINDDPRTFLDIRVPLRTTTKEIFGVCCISRDITDYRRAMPKVRASAIDYASEIMREVMTNASKIASTEGTVLLLGESGSGKDHLARWLHDRSPRSTGPYFTINCAALSPELAESELFGHEAGAFTGARGRKRGMVELAEGGTLLLNEIGELTLPLQSKLLTFLDTLSFLRVGGETSVNVDVRLMAATHRDLAKEVREGRFLEPLFYRLNVFTIEVPPLRERLEEIPFLVQQIMAELAEKMHLSQIPVIDSAKLEGLTAYNWPGNIRELKNAIERALMLWGGGRLDVKLPASATPAENWVDSLPFPSHWKLREATDEVTKLMCIEALRRTGGNKKAAAQILGISRDALYRHIGRFGINTEMLT